MPNTSSIQSKNWACVARFTLVLFAFVPAMWGQARLGSNESGAGVLFLIGFLMAAAASLWRGEKMRFPSLPPVDPALSKRWWWTLPSIPLALVCFYLVYQNSESYRLVVRLWVASLALLVCPFLIAPSRSRNRAEAGSIHGASFSSPPTRKVWAWELALSTALLLVAIAYRLPYLERFPALIHVDEGNCGLMSMEVIQEWKTDSLDWFKPRSFYHFITLGFAPGALFQVLFPPNLFGLRFSSVFLGMIALVLLYQIVRDLFGRTAGLLFLGLGGVAHCAVHWARSGITYGHVPFLLSVCAWHLWKAEKTGRAVWFILTGMWCGVCCVTYNAAQAIPVWICVLTFVLFVSSGKFRRRFGVSLALPIVSFLVFMAPVIAWCVKAPEITLNRGGTIIFTKNAHSIRHMKLLHGEDYLGAVFRDNLKKIALVINKTPDSSTQYGYGIGGFMDGISAAAFVLGLGVALPRILNFRYWILLLAIFLTLFLGGALTLDAPQYMRLVGIVLIVNVLPALWGREVYIAAGEALGRAGKVVSGVLFGLALVYIGWINFNLYFIRYDAINRSDWDYRHSCIVRDARDDGPRNFTYVYKNGFPVEFRQQANLFVSHARRFGVFVEPEEARLPSWERFDSVTFVFPTGHRNLIEKLKTRFPQGRLESRKAPFRERPVIHDRYIVHEGSDGN